MYFVVAPALPEPPAGDVRVLVAGGVGMLMVAATALSLVPARDTTIGPLLILLGSGLLVAALNAGGVGAAANVFEAMLAAVLGLLFARMLATPVVAIAVPLFVAAIDIWSVANGPSKQLFEAPGDRVDALSFDLPTWGDGGSVGRLGLSDAVFLAMFATWAWRYDFRRVPTIVGLVLGLLASLVLGVALDRAIPALPLIAAGYLLPNLDRIGRVVRMEPAD
ncbi:MAG: hypothetical protein ACRDKY_08925 [Solirubrobacteraceae bacterium]